MTNGLYGQPCYWRATMQPARMLVWDARLAPVVGLFLVHARLWTALLVVAVLGLGLFVQHRGMSLPSGLRWLRAMLAGRFRPATSKPPRRAVSWSGEGQDGWQWHPGRLQTVPPPRWLRRGLARLERMAGQAQSGQRE